MRLHHVISWTFEQHWLCEDAIGLQANIEIKKECDERVSLEQYLAFFSVFYDITSTMRRKSELMLGTTSSGRMVNQSLAKTRNGNELLLEWCFTERYITDDEVMQLTMKRKTATKTVLDFLRSPATFREVARLFKKKNLINRTFYRRLVRRRFKGLIKAVVVVLSTYRTLIQMRYHPARERR